MKTSEDYQSAASGVNALGSVVPGQLAEPTNRALHKLSEALGGDVSGYVANRLHMNQEELRCALAAEQVDGVALAMYNIEKRSQSVIIGDQTGIGKGRQAAAMIRYGLLAGYLPIFFTDRYTLFSDMYRDCKALGIKDARPLVVNAGVSVFDFDKVVESADEEDLPEDIWTPASDAEEEDIAKHDADIQSLYQKRYEVVYKAPKKKVMDEIYSEGDIAAGVYDYLMVTYSQLKDARRDMTRVNFLRSLCEKHRVLFIFDEAHRSSSVSAGKISIITQGINLILTESPQTQCVFLSATFAKRPESLITFMRRTALSALATEDTLEDALHAGGVQMQEYVSSCLAGEGQMIRREHSSAGIPTPVYTYLEDELVIHSELFDKVMYYFREIAQLSSMVRALVKKVKAREGLPLYKAYPTLAQLFYINKVLLLSLKAQTVAQTAVEEVRSGRSVVIGMSDTLECVLRDAMAQGDGAVRGDISVLLLRLLEKTVRSSGCAGDGPTVFEEVDLLDEDQLTDQILILNNTAEHYYHNIANGIREEVFHLPMSPIDVIRQLIERETFRAPGGETINIRFEECTGRAHQLQYLSPDGDDDFIHARVTGRRKRHSNHIFNDFQNNKLDVILVNACGAIGASAHAIATAEVPEEQVRQRKMLIVQNDLDVNIDLQKRGRINRTGQRTDLPPLYEYIITAIPSEKRLNMMLRAKLRSLSANTTACQDQDKEQADFADLSNKYGNEVAADYLAEHPELAMELGLAGKVTASKLLARIAMLDVSAQEDIVDDLMAAYAMLEAELRRINQWDLERDYRDFEAQFVNEELFTTAKADTKLGGCSYLTTYKCKHKTFPYDYSTLMQKCDEAKARYGHCYADNAKLQRKVRAYYSDHIKQIHQRYDERRELLHANAKRMLVKYCGDASLAEDWLERAKKSSESWHPYYFADVDRQPKSKMIMRKLVSYSSEFNFMADKEKRDVKKQNAEKKRLVTVLSKAEIGSGYANVRDQLASEECPQRVMAVLRDIRFGKDERTRLLPSRVELVFALTALATEVTINLVHNSKWSNYERVEEILDSEMWIPNQESWNTEIARNNNKIIERKIITGNILGAYVHPAIAELKPRFITFSLHDKVDGKVQTQIGLLLPIDETKLRETLKSVSVPLHKGMKYATSTSSSYTIAGLGTTFHLLPHRVSDTEVKYVISVADDHSRDFESDPRFADIRPFFLGSAITSIYDKKGPGRKSHKMLLHYQTDLLAFGSEPFQKIIQTLSQLDAVIIVPRDQISYGDMKDFASDSEHDDNAPWDKLDWKNDRGTPLPPAEEKLLLRISAPPMPEAEKGMAVSKHTEHYLLAKETQELSGLPLDRLSTMDALRRCYLKWKKFYNASMQQSHLPKNMPSYFDIRALCRELRAVAENKARASVVSYSPDAKDVLQHILDSEHLEADSKFLARFDEEMLFMSPDKAEAQAFADEMPCSPRLDGIRRSLQDYIDGKTDFIDSPDWV